VAERVFWLIIRNNPPINELAIFQYHSWLRRTLEGEVEEVACKPSLIMTKIILTKPKT